MTRGGTQLGVQVGVPGCRPPNQVGIQAGMHPGIPIVGRECRAKVRQIPPLVVREGVPRGPPRRPKVRRGPPLGVQVGVPHGRPTPRVWIRAGSQLGVPRVARGANLAFRATLRVQVGASHERPTPQIGASRGRPTPQVGASRVQLTPQVGASRSRLTSRERTQAGIRPSVPGGRARRARVRRSPRWVGQAGIPTIRPVSRPMAQAGLYPRVPPAGHCGGRRTARGTARRVRRGGAGGGQGGGQWALKTGTQTPRARMAGAVWRPPTTVAGAV